MIFLLLLSTILATSNGSLMSDDDYSIWDNLNLLPDDKDYVFPIEDSKDQESLETGFVDDSILSTIDQSHGSPNSVIRSAAFDCGSSTTEEPDYMDYETNLTQHIDFLETIFEETSEELQSDSDRSDGTTHWLGSDSETESVIHITSNQTTSGEQLDCSESECHSIVPEKCRCQSSSGDCYCWCKSSTTSILKENRWTALPRSLSRSSTSSCSSSLIQFENNERACAVVSPSGYSYDSLEYSNCSNSYFDNTSPDSLEDSENEIFSPKEYNSNNENIPSYSNIRPYRSFESLDTCDDNQFGNLSSYKKRQFTRDIWQETYDREDYSHGTFEDDNYHNHPSLDWTSTIDLREIGLESDGREAVLLSLTRSQIGSTSDSPYVKLNIDYGNNTALRIMPTEQRGWSNSKSSDFNFRFTNKSRSVPSLPSDFDELSSSAVRNLYCNDIYETSSTTDLFSKFTENFTRVNSVPVNLNLFGSNTSQVSTYDSVNAEHHEMADETDKMANYQLNTFCNNAKSETEEEEEEGRPAVKYVNVENEEENSQDISSTYTAKINNNSENGIKKKTVKIQDRGFDVLTIENNIDAVVDEAIRQLGNQVEEINYSGDNTERVMESIPRIPSVKDRSRRMKNNASYELAQQWEIDEKSLKFLPSSPNFCNSPATRKRVLNHASYELAQQSDYIKGLQLTSRPFQRMNACDELHESSYNEEKNTSSYGNNKKYLEGPNNDRYQQDGLLNQIKKNSVGFSIYGGLANSSNDVGPLIDDEVDFSYLETKVIGNHNKVERELEITVDTNNERKNNVCENEFNDDGLMTMTNEEDKLDECAYSDKMALVAENSKKVNGERACDAKHDRQNLQQIPEMISKEQEKLASVLVDESREKKEGESSQQQQQQCIQPTEQSTVHATRVCNHASALNTRSGNSIVGCDLGECGTEREEKKKEVIYEGGDNQPKSQPTLVMLTKSLENDAMVTVPSDASGDDEKKNKRGLGGFLQRFSKFRFSGRSKSPRLESKRSNSSKIDTKTSETQPTSVGKKFEPNYIIIPLHPPEEETNTEEKRQNDDSLKNASVSTDTELNASFIGTNGRPPVCTSKPPLPPLQSIRACASSARTTSTPDAVGSRRRAITDLGNPAIIKMAKARAMQQHHHHQHQYHHHQAANQPKDHPGGLLETDLDAEIQDVNEDLIGPSSIDGTSTSDKKTRSLLNLTHTSRQGRENVLLRVPQSPAGFSCDGNTGDHPDYTITGKPINQRPHKSMEFLLDKENLHFIKPPENELQKGMAAERVPSEHELRVQRSLQRLNVPDWYKNSPAARDGFRLKRHSDASQHSGWRSLGSKTTSLSSLSSSSNLRQPNRGLLLSPSPQPVFSRWSTSLLNSTGSSPATSTGSSFNYRQPYLGWRSQERLANPRTPAERLAQGILPHLDAKQKQQQQRSSQQLDVRNSIKEVTSAIVHYVQSGQEVSTKGGRSSPRLYSDNKDENRSNEDLAFNSPRGEGMKLCWMESSFVGSRPVDSPETPMSLTTDKECSGCSAMEMKSCSCVNSANSGLYLDLVASDVSNCPSPSSASYHRETQRYHHRDITGQDVKEPKGVTMTAAFFRNKPSPGSTTLEDVLDSLLGLPSASSRTPSPGSKTGKSCNDLRQDLPESVKREIEIIEKTLMNSERKDRRKSEGSDTMPSSHHFSRNRRVSFDNTAPTDKYVVKCKNNKCTNSTTLAEARKIYESCHYCMYLYCSKECRRAHWLQRHRKTCLHSRVGALCRQVFSAAKDDSATLKHISLLARRGYVAHGRGAVKCFFSSPESAEKFIANRFKDLGELTYVRSSDLLLSEMGADLYTEVMRLCKSYNPDTKMVLYVAICVVKEVPCAEVGGVRWERQLISRCGKIRQDTSQHQQQQQQQSQSQQHHQDVAPPKSVSQPVLCNITREMDSPETLVLTSLPQSNDAGEKENTPNKAREIGFANIQRQLKLRGVSLRRHFPQVYKKLCSYVDGSVDKFAPVTIYPIDQASGKSFMCIIMLDAEPERLQLLPTDSSRVKTIDISAIEQE